MASKPENSFRNSVHKYLPVGLHHEKMCNPYSSGTADDWYSGNKCDLWIEYKFLPKVPLRANVLLYNPNVKKPIMSKLQWLWLNGRYEEGRNIAVVVGCPQGGLILHNQEWNELIPAQTFRDNLIPRKGIAQWIMQITTR